MTFSTVANSGFPVADRDLYRLSRPSPASRATCVIPCEDLRLLTNYEMDSENRLCLLFVGLTELRRRLSMAIHESLDQRIVMRYHLGGLEREELSEYLTHRLRAADCDLPLFDPGAIEAIWQATGALPRRINRLAHVALTAAAIDNARTVSAEHVQDALAEIGALAGAGIGSVRSSCPSPGRWTRR